MQIVDDKAAAPMGAQVASPVADGVAAELWLAATVLIAGCTVVMLGALSYIY